MLGREPTNAFIEVSEVPDGALKLRRQDRPKDSGTAEISAAARQRQAARIITMVWGDRYVADLLALTIPALLAPGNVPTFAQCFDCEFVVVTERRLFDLISRSPAIFQLLGYCDVRLVPIDDLLSPWYGITLTYALVRGFADLGDNMINTHLVFLNADFIVADGSYAKLAEAILRGERLVVAPSYCMVQEDTIAGLRARYNGADHSIAISRREMAATIIAHRHNTVRAKTVNQQLFRIHRYDQFYWYVDENTLLARQMPIAVVYMRPEKALTELPTFWDYGVISEYCPTTKPCVLGDSDDFLMAELRTEGTFRELLHLGWPEVNEIADDLSSFTTKDHHDYGRHTLVLHSAGLPAHIDEEKAALTAFVDGVYSRLSPPISYLNHPFWAPAFPRFLAAHISGRRRRESQAQALATMLREDPQAADRHRRISQLKHRIRDIETAQWIAEQDAFARREDINARILELESEFRKKCALIEAEAADDKATLDTPASASPEEIPALEAEVSKLESEQQEQIDRLCGHTSNLLEEADATALKKAAAPAAARLVQIYHRLFGQLPHTTIWHPYHTMLKPALDAIDSAKNVTDVLVISSGGSLGSLMVKGIQAQKLTITPRMAVTGLYKEMISGRRQFGLCVCDLAFEDLCMFREILDKIRPFLTKHARVVVFHHNSALRSLDDATYSFTKGLFPLIGRSRVRFAGSRLGAFTMRMFEKNLNRHGSIWQLSIMAAILAVCAPFARIAANVEAQRPPYQLPKHCTSMTIEIDLG